MCVELIDLLSIIKEGNWFILVTVQNQRRRLLCLPLLTDTADIHFVLHSNYFNFLDQHQFPQHYNITWYCCKRW